MVKPESAKIVVCGIVRDAEKGLRRNIPVVRNVLSRFEDYRIIMIENDSKDATKELLRKWKETEGERMTAVMEDTDASSTIPTARSVDGVNPFFSHKRIDKMAHLRNKYMDAMEKMLSGEDGFEPDYLMVVDMDVAQLYADAIMTSFESDREWDAVCAFGYSTSPKLRRRYHDTYALTLWEEREEPQTEQKIKEYADRLGQLKPTDEWIRVASGFGGVAIYRYEAVKGIRYAEPTLENDDSRVEAKCEHFSIYKQMIERGYDRFYLNPAMQLKYQDLTLSIIWRSLMRKYFCK
jgi:hypothetical protein